MNIPLKWHGGKYYMASKIVDLMPRHIHYVEPFFGGGSVLLARDPEDKELWLIPNKGVSEVVNDINGRLINFWRILQDPKDFESFRRAVEAIPMAREEWERSHSHSYGDDRVADAVAFFIDCRQSRSGMMNGFTSITRSRTRRHMNGNVSEWLSAIDGLQIIHHRLRRVLIERMRAIDMIAREDSPGTLFYCDPPYLHETRSSINVYYHEMSENDHLDLLMVLQSCKGKVMISGYNAPLYDVMLRGWNRHRFDLPNNAAGGESKRRMTEIVWCNY